MSANDKQGAAGEGVSRKQRRAAERAARKSGVKTTGSGTSSGNGSGRSVLLVSIAAIAIGVVAVVALVLVSGGFGDDSVAEPDSPAPAAELRQGRTLVAAAAVDPVVVEVFEDVQCPACQRFTDRVEPLIIAEHVADGTASLTYNDLIVFGEDSVDAAVAMRAADELDGAFWDYHHVLFHNAPDGSISRSWLADIAESIGLEREAFTELLDDPELLAGVQEDMARAATYGANRTPSVVVNGQLLEAANWEEIDAAIESAAAAS